MAQRQDILTPVGRLIAGNLYRPNTTDAEGKPLVYKSGANMGQPRLDYYFMLAIPKGTERGWWETPWGQLIYQVGAAAFPQASQSPTFAWKIKDGDSQVPNKRGKKPCDMEGAKGCWLLSWSSGYPPKVTSENGNVPLTQENAVNLGDYVQVFGYCADNGSQSQSGVYLNHNAVNLAGYGQRISTGVDTAAVGFGQGVVLPAGASPTPIGGFAPPAGVPAMPGVPAVSGVPQMPQVGMPVMPAATPATPMPAMPQVGMPVMPAPTAVAPHPGFLAPVAGAQAVPVPVAPVPVARQMTAKAAGVPYEAYVAQGWNDQLLVQHGLMVA